MRFIWGEPRVAEQYGDGVTETEVRLVDADDKVLPYWASGKAVWKAVDYKDKLPVVGSLRDHLPLEQLWDTNQCVVIHVTAALKAARTKVWPKLDDVLRQAAELKASM